MSERLDGMTGRQAVGGIGALWSRPYLLLTMTALFWAGNSIVGRAARDLVPPVALAFWRWAIALALLLPLAWPHLRRDWPVLRSHWPILLLLGALGIGRSEEHTSELQSLMRISYAVFCLNKKNYHKHTLTYITRYTYYI